jgi:hypothetical protein
MAQDRDDLWIVYFIILFMIISSLLFGYPCMYYEEWRDAQMPNLTRIRSEVRYRRTYPPRFGRDNLELKDTRREKFKAENLNPTSPNTRVSLWQVETPSLQHTPRPNTNYMYV